MQRGVVSKDCAETFMIYTFAKQFGWTPDQIDGVEDATLRELYVLIDEVAKEEERQMKKNMKK